MKELLAMTFSTRCKESADYADERRLFMWASLPLICVNPRNLRISLRSVLRRRLGNPLLLLSILLPLSGCSSFSLGLGLFGDDDSTSLESVRVETAADANTDMATALDLVFVYDKKLARQLPANGPAWFRQREALRKAHPEQLDVVSLEIPPGRTLDDIVLPDNAGDAIAVRAYANHVATAGQAPLDLTDSEDAVIRILARDIALGSKGE